MTTDVSVADRAAGLEALRGRRPSTSGIATPGSARPRPTKPSRRRHAAAGARILAGGLSAATALALVGAMAGGFAGGAAPATGETIASTPSPAVVIVRRSIAQPAGIVDAPAAPQVRPAVAAPVSASQAS